MLGGRRRVVHTISVFALALALLAPGVPQAAQGMESAAVPVRILPLGDSITAGAPNTPDPQPTYRMYLYDHLVASGLAAGTGFDLVGRYDEHPSGTYDFLRQGEWDHDSESVSGKRTLWASQVVGGAVRDFDPEVVLVLIGINDLRQDITPQEAAANIEEVVDRARFKPDVDIVLAEIPPAAGFEALVEEYNALVREIAASKTTSTSRVVTVDLYTGFDLEVYSYDGVHPNYAGDEWIAERFADVLHTEFGIGDPWGGEPVAPTTTITDGPSGTVDTSDATFTFEADVAEAAFECQLDGAGYQSCVSPQEYTGLGDGSHTFEVRATADGLTGDPASQSWTVELPEPVVPPVGPTPDAQVPGGAVRLVADWNGDGVATPGWFYRSQWTILEQPGGPIVSFSYGRATDTPVVGDWNGSGEQTVGVRRGNQWFLRNSNSAGPGQVAFAYGRSSDVPVVGDWNGSGQQTAGVVRDSAWLLRNANSTGIANLDYTFR